VIGTSSPLPLPDSAVGVRAVPGGRPDADDAERPAIDATSSAPQSTSGCITWLPRLTAPTPYRQKRLQITEAVLNEYLTKVFAQRADVINRMFQRLGDAIADGDETRVRETLKSITDMIRVINDPTAKITICWSGPRPWTRSHTRCPSRRSGTE
jgi:hypothetical protein